MGPRAAGRRDPRIDGGRVTGVARKGLTPGEARMLRFIAQHVTEHGYPPTFLEMARSVGSKSSNTASCFVDRLVLKGVLTKGPKKASRAMAITEAGKRQLAELEAQEQLA